MTEIGAWLAGIPGWRTPAEWQAIGAMGTLAVAAAAAIFAWFQIRELRRTREEQARPYVAVYWQTDGRALFFVVKNFGSTTAREVRLSLDKPIKRSFKVSGEHETLRIFDILPVMVPGQEWRTFYDTGVGLLQEELTETYTVTASYRDARGRRLPDDTFILDWSTFKDIEWIGEKTMDDIGDVLEKMQRTLASWTDGIRGLSVVNRDGDAKDAAHRADLIKRGKLLQDP